ncbi:MAG TPA: hypothetical protein DCE41_01570 [Cytophagales bacterium]|nr:hypothetical protein [Cytophagales bacterium]
MMKKKNNIIFTLILALLLLPVLGWAQPADAVEGSITTTDGEEINILLDYDLEQNVLRGYDLASNRQYAFTPSSVISFQFYDRDLQRQRSFYSLPYRENGQISSLQFFEALVEGPVSLLGREYAVENGNGGTVDPAGRILIPTADLTRWVYFTVSEEQEITPLKLRSRKILSLMETRKDDIKAYIERWELDITFQKDLIKIFSEYNRLLVEES